MLIAGEPSGDQLAADLVTGLRQQCVRAKTKPTLDYQPLHSTLQPRFFGAGGPKMASAGVELALDLAAHAVVGFSDVLRQYFKFRRIFHRLFRLAIERQPDAIVCVDFSGFNRRFAHAVRSYTRVRHDWFHDWHPKLVQYVSPQVWASREGRVYQMARDYDLLLSIFPFEPAWYARRVPRFRVEFIGHPLAEHYPKPVLRPKPDRAPRTLILLPGSRRSEIRHHLPIMNQAGRIIRQAVPELKLIMIAPNETIAAMERAVGFPPDTQLLVGGLSDALSTADLAIASTGTVTLECALFGVPTVALYKTTPLNYFIAKSIATVQYAAMPNLLAAAQVIPEFIQPAATPERIAEAALDLLRNPQKSQAMRERLLAITEPLRMPGTRERAAKAIVRLLDS